MSGGDGSASKRCSMRCKLRRRARARSPTARRSRAERERRRQVDPFDKQFGGTRGVRRDGHAGIRRSAEGADHRRWRAETEVTARRCEALWTARRLAGEFWMQIQVPSGRRFALIQCERNAAASSPPGSSPHGDPDKSSDYALALFRAIPEPTPSLKLCSIRSRRARRSAFSASSLAFRPWIAASATPSASTVGIDLPSPANPKVSLKSSATGPMWVPSSEDL
jgi:hypothetical protein